MVIGPITQFPDRSSALLAIAALRCEINPNDPRLSLRPVTVSELVNYYRQRELVTDHTWKTHSTKNKAPALRNTTGDRCSSSRYMNESKLRHDMEWAGWHCKYLSYLINQR